MNFDIWIYLTDNYKKAGGNIQKIALMIIKQMDEAIKALKSLSEIHSLEKSYGKNLDRIGDEEGAQRKGRADDDYKAAIRFEITRKEAAEDINSINAALDFYLKDSFEALEEGNATITIVASRFLSDEEKQKMKGLPAAGIGTKFRTEQKLEKASIKIAILCLTGEETTI